MITIGRQFETDREVTVRGKKIPYHTVTREMIFTNDQTGVKEATAWTYAYVRSDVDSADRAVMFCYNGGPGCSCLPIHSSLLSPEKVSYGDGVSASVTGPFAVKENTQCLIDVIDIVCIDPVGCGYGRLFDTPNKMDYVGTENDCIATARIIDKWMNISGRTGCPVWLCGESYGTTRNALTSDYLYSNPKCAPHICVSGIIMIGSAMDHGQEQYHIFRAVLTLPTLAATYRYHHPDKVEKSLEEFVDEALDFAWNDYAHARLFGSFLSEDEQRKIAEKLNYFTGVNVDYLMKHGLEIDSFSYKQYLYDTEGYIVSNYDTRFANVDVPYSIENEMKNDDRDSAVAFPAMTSALYRSIRQNLGIDITDDYVLMADMESPLVTGWSFKTRVNPLNSLEKAMQRNPKMKLFMAAGIYDLLTTWGYVRYVMSHNNYPADRTKGKYYPSGHMIYLSDDCADELLQDMRAFITE